MPQIEKLGFSNGPKEIRLFAKRDWTGGEGGLHIWQTLTSKGHFYIGVSSKLYADESDEEEEQDVTIMKKLNF